MPDGNVGRLTEESARARAFREFVIEQTGRSPDDLPDKEHHRVCVDFSVQVLCEFNTRPYPEKPAAERDDALVADEGRAEAEAAALVEAAITEDPERDPVLAIVPLLTEADALAKQGDDDASDRFCYIQSELAAVRATTLPGLRAHLQQFARLVHPTPSERGAGKVMADQARGVAAALADDALPGATRPTLHERLERIGELVEGFNDADAGIWFDNIVEAFEALFATRPAAPALPRQIADVEAD